MLPQTIVDPTFDIEKMKVPILNFRQTASLAAVPVQLWAIAAGLFMACAPMCGWVEYLSPTVATVQCFAGFVLYLIGFFDWYQGRCVLATVDFICGLMFFSWYLIPDLGKYDIFVANLPSEPTSYMRGVFYILFLVFLVVVIIGCKDRGILYIASFAVFALGIIFHSLWEFSKKRWSRKVAGYCYLVAAVLFFITGVGKVMNDVYMNPMLPCVLPNL